LKEPSERKGFLDRTCGDDPSLKSEVESLLRFHEQAGGLLDSSPSASVDTLIGRTLGSYTVKSLMGSGGMGAVYRAWDSRLKRDVAIKVLPDEFSRDTERILRFQREAEILASLNQPHIAAIYDLGETEGVRYLVLELVEGETLADRLKRGPIPVGETLHIALQIADALEAAHEKGVIHRDLKPANIQLTGEADVKILDFGLAKAAASGLQRDAADSPTVTAEATQRGVLMGTAAYMSPEQACGRTVDPKTDIWAFGCVLYEMLAGRSLFRQNTITETLAKVLEGRVDLDKLPPQTPAAIVRLIQRCLERDPRERLQHIGDARVEIRDAIASFAAPSRTPARVGVTRWRRFAVVSSLILLALLGGWFFARQTVPEPALVTKLFDGPVAVPAGATLGQRRIAISRDGTRFAYSSGAQLFTRPMNSTEAVPIADRGANLFFSPDGKWLGFSAFYDIFKVNVNGGAPIKITTYTGRNMGSAWGPNGQIVYSNGAGLYSVSEESGEPKLLIKSDREDVLYTWPEFLPNGRSLLFTRVPAGSADAAEIMMLDLQTLKPTLVLRGASSPSYLPPGHLIYVTARGLEAIAFDPDTGAVTGDPVTPGVNVALAKDNGAADFAVSDNGTLVYLPPRGSAPNRLVWVDRDGKEESIDTIDPDFFGYLRISPDGRRVAANIGGSNRDIYVLDLERGRRVRISEGPTEDLLPVWNKDGSRLYYSSNRTGTFQVYSRASDGTGPEKLVVSHPDVQMTLGMTPNNHLLFFRGSFDEANIGVLDPSRPESIDWVLSDGYKEVNADVAPDGKWIAYQSNESGEEGIWVRPYPNVGDRKFPIGQGVQPRWGSRGDELFYQNAEGGMMVVSIQASPAFRAGPPRLLFPNRRYIGAGGRGGPWMYDIAPDGRFLLAQRVGDPGPREMMIGIVLNWRQELKDRLPQ
jgi:serine/threonine-protein kinase